MPQRDPDTGKFVPSGALEQFDEVLQAYQSETLSVPAADLDGTTNQGFGEATDFEGLTLYNMDDLIDRDQVATLLWSRHAILAYLTSTMTADSTVRGALEFSLQPNRDTARMVRVATANMDAQQGVTENDFTIDWGNHGAAPGESDVIGPALYGVGFGPFSDGASGVGGGAAAGEDSWEGSPVQSVVVDDRDQIFANGAIETQNVSDGAAHLDFTAWHVWGVTDA